MEVLASDSAGAGTSCPTMRAACGTDMLEKRGTLRLPVNGEETAVPSAAHLRCPK